MGLFVRVHLPLITQFIDGVQLMLSEERPRWIVYQEAVTDASGKGP
ncbi:MAG: hypothetical protein MZU95_14760 [Desulfomicrobium escambiense]|nr:hypothetical protein [Desulfomicrobium escambiense]